MTRIPEKTHWIETIGRKRQATHSAASMDGSSRLLVVLWWVFSDCCLQNHQLDARSKTDAMIVWDSPSFNLLDFLKVDVSTPLSRIGRGSVSRR